MEQQIIIITELQLELTIERLLEIKAPDRLQEVITAQHVRLHHNMDVRQVELTVHQVAILLVLDQGQVVHLLVDHLQVQDQEEAEVEHVINKILE